jgi:hypothetical protein
MSASALALISASPEKWPPIPFDRGCVGPGVGPGEATNGKNHVPT